MAGEGNWTKSFRILLVQHCPQPVQACIYKQNIRPGWISKSKDWCICEFFNDEVESIITSGGPTTAERLRDLEIVVFLTDVFLFLLRGWVSFGKLCQWADYCRVILDETPIVSTETQKRL